MTPPRPAIELPLITRVVMHLRMLSIQSGWNYEVLLGTGIAFCVEPALRLLEGGRGGPAYREALARESRYFNSHPYMAALAIGALARAELDREPPARIERFRTALCGPLGSVGDRLVWAAWLPFCSLVGLAAFGAGIGAAGVVILFLTLYNAGHIALRVWGLETGWRRGLGVATALGNPLLRQAPPHIARAAALVAGFAVPLALNSIIGPGRGLFGVVLIGSAVGALVLIRLHGRAEGWPIALVLLALFAIYSVAI
jgi:PTS system mannose-specific IID component